MSKRHDQQGKHPHASHIETIVQQVEKHDDAIQKEYYDRAMVRVTLAGAIIAFIAAIAAYLLYYEAHETRIHDERPFLAVDIHKETAQAAKFGDLDHLLGIDINSIGKSPAFKILGTCETHYQKTRDPLAVKNTTTFNDEYMIPGRSDFLPCPYVLPAGSDVTDTDPLILVGYVNYSDDSGTKYFTPFCFDVGTQRSGFLIAQCSPSIAGLPPLK